MLEASMAHIVTSNELVQWGRTVGKDSRSWGDICKPAAGRQERIGNSGF